MARILIIRTPPHRRNPERHGRRNRCACRETVEGAAGQAGDDVRAADGEGEVGVSIMVSGRIILSQPVTPKLS